MPSNILKELDIKGVAKFRTGLIADVQISVDGKTWTNLAKLDRREEYQNPNKAFNFARVIGLGVLMEKPPYKPRPGVPIEDLPNGVKIARDSGCIYASTDGDTWYEC